MSVGDFPAYVGMVLRFNAGMDEWYERVVRIEDGMMYTRRLPWYGQAWHTFKEIFT